MRTNRVVYNKTVRDVALIHSAHLGYDTPESRQSQAQWCRRLRKEFPLSSFGVTWGISVKEVSNG